MMTDKQLKQLELEWTGKACEKVKLEEIKGTIYCYGSERACLRMYYIYRHSMDRCKVDYSPNLNTWFFRLER